MSRNDRWRRIAEHLAQHRYDDALEDIVQPVFGDFPPKSLLLKQLGTPQRFKLWRYKVEKSWLRWMDGVRMPELNKFHVTRELSSAYQLRLYRPTPKNRKKLTEAT